LDAFLGGTPGLQTAIGNDGGTIESSGVYNPDGSLTVTYNGVKGWYGSYSKITYYQSVTEGLNYKLVFEGKAQTARDILIRFVDGAGVVVPGFENRLKVTLGTEFAVQEFLFVAPNTGTYNLQLQFGWEGHLLNATDPNVLDIKQFKLIAEKVTAEPVALSYMVDDFESYADQAALDLIYMHRVPNAGANHNDAHVAWSDTEGHDGSNALKLTFGQHAVTGWDLVRTKANITTTGLTNDYLYFAFWFKGDGVVTNVYLWLYWSGSQNSQAIDVSQVPASGGYVYIPLANYGKTATEITQYAIGYNLANTTTQGFIFIDNVQFITHPNALVSNPT